MALSAKFSLLHSELNDFLFAEMGEEKSGAPITVLSALTRLGIDPWAEGARLSELPKDAAAEALAPMIARFPRRAPGGSTAALLAERLVGLLPQRVETVIGVPPPNRQATGWQEPRHRLGGLARIARAQRWPARLTMPAWFGIGLAVTTLLLWWIGSIG